MKKTIVTISTIGLFCLIYSTTQAQKISKQWIQDKMQTHVYKFLNKQVAVLQPANPNVLAGNLTNETNISNTKEPESEIHAAINPKDSNNIVVACMKTVSSSAFVYRIYYTKDFGRTWKTSAFEGVIPLTPANRQITGGGDPVLAFDKEGKVYFTWLITDAETSGTGAIFNFSIYCINSSDGGITWSNETLVDKSSFNLSLNDLLIALLTGKVNLNGDYIDKEWLATDVSNSPHQGNVYVPYVKAIAADSTYRIMLKRKLATKTTFESIATRVSPDSLVSSLFPSIDVDSKGNIHILFMSSTIDAPNLSMYYSQSSNGGITFSKPKKISDIQIPVLSPDQANAKITGIDANRIYPCPQIKVDNSTGSYSNRIYTVWAANGTDYKKTEGMDIYLSYSSDNGLTWTIPKVVNDDIGTKTEQFHPALTISPTGTTAITWYDRRDDINNIKTNYYSTISKNGGVSFEPNKAVSTKAADFSVIGKSNQNFGIGEYATSIATQHYLIPFWCDGRTNDGNIEVYTTTIPLNSVSTGINEFKSLNTNFVISNIYPNPANDALQINIEFLNSISDCDIWIVNSEGRIVHQEKRNNISLGSQQWTLNLNNFTNGMYSCFIRNSKGLANKNFIVAH